jgi:hypothetical protein
MSTPAAAAWIGPEERDMNIPRIGMFAGWITLAGIFGYNITLSIAAGQRVSGTADVAAITSYYKQPIIAATTMWHFPVVVAILVFALALRETLAAQSGSRFLATLGLAFAIAEVPMILTEASLQAALVSVATAGGDVVGLFRFWDVLYNSATYVLEASWLACFGLAMRGVVGFPGWLPRYSYVVAAAQIVNMTAIWIGIPDSATLLGNALFGVWFGATSLGLGRVASQRRRMLTPAPA